MYAFFEGEAELLHSLGEETKLTAEHRRMGRLCTACTMIVVGDREFVAHGFVPWLKARGEGGNQIPATRHRHSTFTC
jgi:hypothetical protein